MKHALLALLWIGVNCAVLRILFTSGLPWYEFPIEFPMANLAVWSWLAEKNVYRRGAWFLLFFVIGLLLFIRLYSVAPRESPTIHRDTANLIESHGPIRP